MAMILLPLYHQLMSMGHNECSSSLPSSRLLSESIMFFACTVCDGAILERDARVCERRVKRQKISRHQTTVESETE